MIHFAEDIVYFFGDSRITSTHGTTFEITKDTHIQNRGDCIIGVHASKACVDLNEEIKYLLKKDSSKVIIMIQVQDYTFNVIAEGHPSLTLEHKSDIVIRKSRFICPRTLAISSSKTALDIPRKIVCLLKNPSITGTMKIRVEKRQ